MYVCIKRKMLIFFSVALLRCIKLLNFFKNLELDISQIQVCVVRAIIYIEFTNLVSVSILIALFYVILSNIERSNDIEVISQDGYSKLLLNLIYRKSMIF